MSKVQQLFRCTCGQMNRVHPDSKKAGKFKCGKCGRVILAIPGSVSGQRSRSNVLRVLIVLALLVCSVAVINGSNPNIKPAREIPMSGSRPPPASLQPPPQTVSPNVRPPSVLPEQKPTEPRLSPVVDNALAYTADHAATQADNRPPPAPQADKIVPPRPAPIAAGSPEKLQLEYPAPGCPEMLPTYDSLSASCVKLDERACNQDKMCSWTKSSDKCLPKLGTYLPIELSADATARFPIREIEWLASPKTIAALQHADNYAARNQFDKAIAEYTQILRSELDFSDALTGRAAAYQRKGDKNRATADYCRLIVTAATRNRRDFARSQIALLTQRPVSNALVAAPDKPLPTPKTGDLEPRRRANAIAPFNVVTEVGSNYLIKLVRANNAKDQIWIFIKGGEPYSTKVPIGNYRLRVASGDTWYGRQELFGPRTRLFRLRNKNGTALDETQLLQFRKERNQIVGMTLNFKGSHDGNLEQEAMSRAEFDEN